MNVSIRSWNEDAIPGATAECYNIDPETPGLVQRTLKTGHLSILRHGLASVSIKGISRACGRQILRKAHADYLEMSQRYCDVSNANMILPEAVESFGVSSNLFETMLYSEVLRFLDSSRMLYLKLRRHGIKKEDARAILPQCIETSMTMSGNFQMWWDFFNLRINQKTQKETRDVAIAILKAFNGRSELFSQHPKQEYLK
jgi:thymidylate synthase (FAD)